MTGAPGLAAIIACCLVFAGCTGGGARPPAAWDDAAARSLALQVLARQGPVGDFSAQLTVRIAPPPGRGDPVTFSAFLWSAADGRTRLAISKQQFPVLTAVLAADGGLIARDERGGRWYRGPAGEGLLGDFRLVIDELRHGPLRADLPVTAGGAADLIRQPGADGPVELAIEPALRAATMKRLLDADGRALLTLTYGTTQDFGGVARPAGVQVAVRGDATDRRARIVRFDPVPRLDPARFRLDPPADAVFVAREEFLDGLGR